MPTSNTGHAAAAATTPVRNGCSLGEGWPKRARTAQPNTAFRIFPAEREISVSSACRIAMWDTRSKPRASSPVGPTLATRESRGGSPHERDRIARDAAPRHRRAVRALSSEGGSGKARQKLFDDLADLLAIHASIEELHFYPAVKAAKTDENVEHSLEEHLDIKRKLSVCMATSLSSDKFLDRLRALEEEVQHHVDDERTRALPEGAPHLRCRSARGARSGDDVDDGGAAEGAPAPRRAAADDGADAVDVAADAGRDQLARRCRTSVAPAGAAAGDASAWPSSSARWRSRRGALAHGLRARRAARDRARARSARPEPTSDGRPWP